MNDKFSPSIKDYAWNHFLNITSDLVFFKDLDSVYIAASLSFAHILGKESIDEIIGKSEYDIFSMEYAENYIRTDALLISGAEQSVTDVTPMTLPDGSQGHLLVSKTAFRDNSGKICGIFGIGHSFSGDHHGILSSISSNYCIFDYSIADDALHIQSNSDSENHSLNIDAFLAGIETQDILHIDSIESLKTHLLRARSEICTGSVDIICSLFGSGYTWHRVQYRSVSDSEGKPIRIIGQISNIQELKDRAALLQNLAGQLMTRENSVTYDPDIVSNVFSLMYNSTDIDGSIQSILESIGSYFDVSRAYIFEDHESHMYCINTFEWCAPGIEPQKDVLQKYEYRFDGERNIYTDNFDDDGLFVCADIRSLPEDQVEVLSAQGILSVIQCALYDDGVFTGFVGFDECLHNRSWTGKQIGTLKLISRLLGIFLAKRRRQNDAAFSADFMSALDQNSSFIYIVNPENFDIIFCNQVTTDTFGSDFVGQKCYKALIGKDEPCSRCPIRHYEKTGKSQPMEILWPDGTWVMAQASPMHWQGRHMVMVSSTDVTRHMSATEELRIRNEEYSIVIAQSGKHIFRYDIPTTRINRFYDASLVYGKRENIPDTPAEILSQGLISPDTADDYSELFDSMAKQIPTGSADVHILQVDGTYRWFHYDYTLVIDNPNGKASSAIVSIGDVDAETKATIELTRRAERDGMTGLYNKAATEEISRRVISKNIDEPCALMIIDLDNLKTINDTMGHVCGDNALKAIASTIRDHFRNTDIVGRIGGDEFFVLLHGSISESVLRTSLRNLIRKIAYKKIPDTDSTISCSIGVAFGVCGTSSYDTLFRQADTALYHVKRNGKRDFAFYSFEMENKDFILNENNRLSLNCTEWFDSSELSKLFAALSTLYPLVISVNLTQNSYYMMEYDTFKARSCPDAGVFDDLIEGGALTYHPDDRQSFKDTFSREKQLAAYKSGKKTLTHTGRQLGDDGILRPIKTTVIFTEDKNGDICQITLSKPL